jgi:uncharacterized protein YndB with AHSA1/START domain
MDATTETTMLERTLSIDARPETVWAFLIDPEKMTRWMGVEAKLEAQPGGAYRCVVIPGHIAAGEVVELDPPNRLVLTWGWELSDSPDAIKPGSSTLEFELTPEGDGTMLRFVHRELPSAAAVESHGIGWDHYLARLEEVAGGGDPGEDPWLTQDMKTTD